MSSVAKSIENVLDSELRIHQIDVVGKSECIVALLNENDIGSLVLMMMFLNITFKHYVNVDMIHYVNVDVIIQRICVAAASISVEAFVESIVSRHEGTNKKGGCFHRKATQHNAF